MLTADTVPSCGRNAASALARTSSTSKWVPIATRQLVRALGGAAATCTEDPTTLTT